MPPSRPYINSMIHELEALAERSWSDRVALEALQAELRYRSSGAAKTLTQRVDARIREMAVDPRSNRHNNRDEKQQKENNKSTNNDQSENYNLKKKIKNLEERILILEKTEKELNEKLKIEIEKAQI